MTCKDCIHERLCVIKAFPDMFENTKWDKEPCDHFKNEADFVEVVRCSECKHLEIINKAPIYAKCKKHGIVFELWQEDTREHFCSFGARMGGDEE